MPPRGAAQLRTKAARSRDSVMRALHANPVRSTTGAADDEGDDEDRGRAGGRDIGGGPAQDGEKPRPWSPWGVASSISKPEVMETDGSIRCR